MNKFLLILALLIPSLADAATLYVRAGATGNGSGSDWLNAFSSLPTFQRGNTYWIADGSYGGLSLSAAESGSTWSYVKKATVAAHGTETGWSNAYGDGRATFGGDVTFHTGYWEVDGATRNEADWSQASAYGFKIGYSNIITLVAGVDRITVKYVEVDSARNQVAVLQSYQEGLWREYLTFSHMLFN